MGVFEIVKVVALIARQLWHRLVAEVERDLSRNNARMQREYPAVHFPPCDLAVSALNHCDYRRYLDSGRAHARFIVQTIRSHTSAPSLAICEWGCGPGRIIQHLRALDDGIGHLVGTDSHEASIDWCRHTLPDIEFLHHGMSPPLPLAAASMDIVVGCAVFTHLDEALHHAWVVEMLRLLRPGGLLIASFHGSRFEDRLAPQELDAYRSGRLVVHAEGQEGETAFVSFAGDRFVREHLLNHFAQVSRLDLAPFRQTVWAAVAPG